ncbi:hypothetical protein [Streptomyces syringium]|uniref:hypothetical protein n=1 Tax=Streptomyces syringium TaxID=76729 RepID=UPI0034145578
MPRARVVPLPGWCPCPPRRRRTPAAIERYLTGSGIAKSSARSYRISLTTWGWMFASEPAPVGPARRGAKPPVFPISSIDDPALPQVLAELAAARAEAMDADTVNRELSIARKAIGWWQRQGWIACDPTIGIERRSASADRTRALAENQIHALWRLNVALREKTYWKMLYESVARADEVLCLNVEDLLPGDERGKITAKGGATEWIHWQSGTAQLLPRLIAGRTRGPLFLTSRKAPAGTATLDVCPVTGRARLSYRRAEEMFEETTRLLANPPGSPEDIENLEGWTLHRLRHSRRSPVCRGDDHNRRLQPQRRSAPPPLRGRTRLRSALRPADRLTLTERSGEPDRADEQRLRHGAFVYGYGMVRPGQRGLPTGPGRIFRGGVVDAAPLVLRLSGGRSAVVAVPESVHTW